MKTSKFLTLGAISIAIASVSLVPAMAAKDGQGKQFRGPQAFLAQMDADGDGKVTVAEMAASQKAEFTARDTDGDGFLSKDEMLAAGNERAQKRMENRVERMIEHGDTDGDGKLSLAEAEQSPRIERMMARLDTDGDGAISTEEMQAMGKHGEGRGDGERKGFGKKKSD